MPEDELFEDLKPLDISCTSSDCQNGLHCFRQTKKLAKANLSNAGGLGGKCRACGVDLIDWNRVYKQDLTDVAYTFSALKFERVRHRFWHVEIDIKAVNYALRKGITEMRIATEKRIRGSVGDAHPFHDGWQTPKAENPIFYAQHATASCCRTCIEEWHGIPRGRALTEPEIEYLAELAMLYIKERLPNLTSERKKIPPIQKVREASKNRNHF